jgi:hypothetical protein
MGRVAPIPHVGYDWMVHRHLPSPDFHRLDWQPYGLRADFADTTHDSPSAIHPCNLRFSLFLIRD